MRTSLLLFITFSIIACSSAKHLNNKWIGKTDQDVINKYGNPKIVFADTLKGKIYVYTSFYPNVIEMKYVSKDIIEPAQNQTRTFEKTIFHFDSLSKVFWVEYKDSTYNLRGNVFKKY